MHHIAMSLERSVVTTTLMRLGGKILNVSLVNKLQELINEDLNL